MSTQTIPSLAAPIRRVLPTTVPPPLPVKNQAPKAEEAPKVAPKAAWLHLDSTPTLADHDAAVRAAAMTMALTVLTVAQSKTVLPVPAHKHGPDFCDFCEQRQAQEQCLKHAVNLCYLTNIVGDGHTKLVCNGNAMAHDLVELAWEALGKPSRAETELICQNCRGWDGCDNAGMQDMFREQDEAAEKAARIAARPGEIASHLCRNVQDEPVDLNLVMLRAMAMRGDLKNESPYGEETSNNDMVAGLRLAMTYLDPVTGRVNRDLM